MNELNQEFDAAVSAARRGGDILRDYFNEGVQIRNKSDSGGKSYDLVSDADEESEQAIESYLKHTFSDHAFLGEESLQQVDINAEHLWVIDPLDGTNNFAHRIEHFAVSIGYYRRGRAMVGVVYNPIRDDLFTVTRGGGAHRNGKPVHVSSVDQLSGAMIGCGFYYDRGEMMQQTLRAIEECFGHEIHGVRRLGTASLDLCMVGCGQLEAFFEYKLSPWDFAAGALFVEEAGGKISDARDNALALGSSSVLATNKLLHSAMHNITQKYEIGS